MCGDIVVNSFSGLNTQDSPAAIQPEQSQDLLNVLLQPGGKSVFKRDGYGSFQTLNSVSTAAVHGGYHFQQTGGSDVQLWGSDTGLYSIVSDLAAVKIATGTVGATWQCADSLGFAYCLDSANDTAVKTDGTSVNTSFQGTIPLGSIITVTPLQLVVAGVSANLSTIYVSGNNNFLDFTIGVLPTSSYTEIINAPGSRITHLAYYFGKLFWWKDQSFGYLSGSASQNTVSVTIVSNQIGTLDNSSAFWNPTNYENGSAFAPQTNTTSSGNPYFNEAPTLGGIFFRGQDSHIYQYDGYTLTRLTRIITPQITSANRRKANSWSQTTQSDFNNGLIVPTVNLSTTVSPGDVIVSSFGVTENSSTSWTNGTATNMWIEPSALVVSTNNAGTITDPDFEGTFSNNYVAGTSGPPVFDTTEAGKSCTVNPQTGSQFLRLAAGNGSDLAVTGVGVRIVDANTGAILDGTSGAPSNDSCSWNQKTFTSSANIGKRVKFAFYQSYTNLGTPLVNVATTTASYIFGGFINYYQTCNIVQLGSNVSWCSIDNVSNGSSTVTSGEFVSQIFDTGITSATYSLSNFAYTVNTSTPAFSLQTSSANPSQNWVTTLTSSGTNAIGNRYARYVSTITTGATDSALTAITAVTILARSSGTYYSAVNNAPNLSSWNSFIVDDLQPGASSITYYTRASTTVFNTNSSTPTWTLQTKNTTVATSTGTYMQLRADFYLTAATETPTINDFAFNWFEGTAADKAYITYFQDAIWIALSSGTTSSTDNEIIYLDLLNNAWLRHDIAANGFAVENNALYFGSVTGGGKIFKYGGVQTDNGAAIRSYWKSKDFTGADPTVQNEFVQADFTFAESSNTVAYTYDIDQSTGMLTTINLPLYSAKSSLIKRGLLLAPGKLGTFYNFQVGDNSSLPKWTMMLHRARYNSLNWIPQTSQ